MLNTAYNKYDSVVSSREWRARNRSDFIGPFRQTGAV